MLPRGEHRLEVDAGSAWQGRDADRGTSVAFRAGDRREHLACRVDHDRVVSETLGGAHVPPKEPDAGEPVGRTAATAAANRSAATRRAEA